LEICLICRESRQTGDDRLDELGNEIRIPVPQPANIKQRARSCGVFLLCADSRLKTGDLVRPLGWTKDPPRWLVRLLGSVGMPILGSRPGVARQRRCLGWPVAPALVVPNAVPRRRAGDHAGFRPGIMQGSGRGSGSGWRQPRAPGWPVQCNENHMKPGTVGRQLGPPN
jgi:hypothetical protein